MLTRLVKRHSVWWPTRLGWLLIAGLLGLPTVIWFFFAEGWLAHTERLPAEALVVEGWIGIEGIKAAKTEFEQGGYRYVVTTGLPSDNRWSTQQWNFAIEAHDLLVRLGVPEDRVIAAPAEDVHRQRTFEMAWVGAATLKAHGLKPASINVFTLGAHARRSRLVFSKAMPSGTAVGAIAWIPSHYQWERPWWQSSERALDLLKESFAYALELLFNSGRLSNSEKPAR